MTTQATLQCLSVNSGQLQPSFQTSQSQAQGMMLSQNAVQLKHPRTGEQKREEKNSGVSENSTGGSSREQEALTTRPELRTTHSSGVWIQASGKRLH